MPSAPVHILKSVRYDLVSARKCDNERRLTLGNESLRAALTEPCHAFEAPPLQNALQFALRARLGPVRGGFVGGLRHPHESLRQLDVERLGLDLLSQRPGRINVLRKRRQEAHATLLISTANAAYCDQGTGAGSLVPYHLTLGPVCTDIRRCHAPDGDRACTRRRASTRGPPTRVRWTGLGRLAQCGDSELIAGVGRAANVAIMVRGNQNMSAASQEGFALCVERNGE
jgi:hypothetical protein